MRSSARCTVWHWSPTPSTGSSQTTKLTSAVRTSHGPLPCAICAAAQLLCCSAGNLTLAGFLTCVYEQAVENEDAIVWELQQLGYGSRKPDPTASAETPAADAAPTSTPAPAPAPAPAPEQKGGDPSQVLPSPLLAPSCEALTRLCLPSHLSVRRPSSGAQYSAHALEYSPIRGMFRDPKADDSPDRRNPDGTDPAFSPGVVRLALPPLRGTCI